MARDPLIVIGASAGGMEALFSLTCLLPADLAAPLLVVVHLSPTASSHLPRILQRMGPLPATFAQDQQAIQPGQIYIAPPDHHLMVRPGHLHVTQDPKENGFRPAVDPLFRSAATAYGPAVIGIILSGALDDGTAGLLTVKRRGGTAVVQDPAEALFGSMPESALTYVDVDYTVPVAEMAPLLIRLVDAVQQHEGVPMMPEDMDDVGMAHSDALGRLGSIRCPECSGPLTARSVGRLPHYQCHVGHAFSPQSLAAAQATALDQAQWTTLSLLNERVTLLHHLLATAHSSGDSWAVRRFSAQLRTAEHQRAQLHQLLEHTNPPLDEATSAPLADAGT